MARDHFDSDGRRWPVDLAGIDRVIDHELGCPVTVGPGWRSLVDGFAARVARHAPGAILLGASRDDDGGLALDVAWAEGAEWGWMAKSVRSQSFVTCERCGGPAALRHHRRPLEVLCDDHERARAYQARLLGSVPAR